MKITFCMLAFNSDHVLRPVLRAIAPYGDVVCAEGPCRYWQTQGYHTSTDDTRAILAAEIGDHNVVHGSWPEKDEMQKALEPLIPDDTTHVWLVDADEVMPPHVFDHLLPRLDELDSVSLCAYSYYGGFDRVITGFEAEYEAVRIQRWYKGATWATHRPPTVLSPCGKPWANLRHARGRDLPRYHHYSMVYPSQMVNKARYYGDRGGWRVEYLESVYFPWINGTPAERESIERDAGTMHTHEWSFSEKPCFTAPAPQPHPPTIAAELPALVERFEREREEWSCQTA